MERRDQKERDAAWARITVEASPGFVMANVMTALRSLFPDAAFRPARRVRAGWRVRGVLHWNWRDDIAQAPEETKGGAPASPEAKPLAQAEVLVTHTDAEGTMRFYPFHAALPSHLRLRNARYRILTDKERRSVTAPIPPWELDYIDTYRRRRREADGWRLSREDVIAEALALFAATHPLPEPDEEVDL